MRRLQWAAVFLEGDLHDDAVFVDWLFKHDAKCNNSNIVFAFSHANGIGTNVYVKCRSCRRRKDITDYGSW